MRARCARCGAAALLLSLAAVRMGTAQASAEIRRPDGTRVIAGVLAELERAEMERSIPRRLGSGLPVERLPDLSHAGALARGAEAARLRRRLATVRDSGLTEEERITLRVLRWDLGAAIEEPRHHWLSFAAVTPYSSPMREVSEAFARASLRDASDVTRYERLLALLPAFADSMRAGLEGRAARGIRLPKAEIPAVAALMRSYAGPAGESPFVPDAGRLSSLPEPAATAFRARAAAVVDGKVKPAFERLVAYLEGSYRERAPATVGQWQYPGGDAYYRFLVRRETTMEITPREVHDIGLREVARIDGEMAAIRRELGFTGSGEAFHAKLRADPRFIAATPEEVRDRLMGHAARIMPVLDRWFRRFPRAQGDARRLDPALEPAMTFGFYGAPTATDSMGHYFFNGSRLAERSQITAAPLIYHELLPGHHLQFNLQRENAALPPYRRHAAQTAFTEGWGEYASRLAGEMGMYADPYDRYGRLFMEMFLACRLVVDTGMNALRWPRDSAIAFMRPRVAESMTQLGTETLRYSVDLPGQALAYKMGSLEIVRLRDEARAALGARFDVRDFHDVVLGSGSLPLSVLAWKVRRWTRGEA